MSMVNFPDFHLQPLTEIFIQMQKFQIRLANQSNRRDGVKCMLEREPN